MPFKTKKINIETLSEYLLGTRKLLRLSLKEVSRQTGIAFKFLENLESGKFQALPATVYVIGFLKKLAQVYNVSESALIEQFKKERVLSQEISKTRVPAKSKVAMLFSKVVVTPKFLSLTAGFLFVLITLGYIGFQVISIYGNPQLSIYEPQNSQKISGSAVTVSGQTDPGNTMSINNQPVLVDAKDGKFQAVVSLTSGQKDLLLVASNKFNKSTTKTVSLLVDDGSSAAIATAPLEKEFKLTMNFTDAVKIMVSTDGGPAESETFTAGSSKTVTATDKVLISTSNAGATIVQLGSKLLGPLGKKNESLVNVPFSIVSAGAVLSSQDAAKKNSN